MAFARDPNALRNELEARLGRTLLEELRALLERLERIQELRAKEGRSSARDVLPTIKAMSEDDSLPQALRERASVLLRRVPPQDIERLLTGDSHVCNDMQ
jgi:hypothetical protein